MKDHSRRLITFACADDLLRDLTVSAIAHNRSVAVEIETRLMALRLVEESLRILNTRENAQDQTLSGVAK